MNTYVALFRGINVGGKNRISMAELKQIIEGCGYENVVPYIQSGNVLFSVSANEAGRFAKQVGDAIQKRFGFKPKILTLCAEDFEKSLQNNPFQGEDPKTFHLYFLADLPGEHTLEEVCAPSEKFELIGRVLYLYAPEGIGRSKLVAQLERCLGVSATGRNGKTVLALQKMLAF